MLGEMRWSEVSWGGSQKELSRAVLVVQGCALCARGFRAPRALFAASVCRGFDFCCCMGEGRGMAQGAQSVLCGESLEGSLGPGNENCG